MSKVSIHVGYETQSEIAPGVWGSTVKEVRYKADLTRDIVRSTSEDKIHNDIYLNNQFAIVANTFAHQNVQFMRYVKYKGVNWRISSFEINKPRLTIYVGGVYGEP